MSESEIIMKLRSVLEKYFSPDNLRNDIHLTQILAKQQFVTMDEILRLSLIKKTLEAEEIPEEQWGDVILTAIRGMPEMLTLYDNDQYVIPRIPQNRTTLILRDLPEDATLEEIKALLNNPQCQNIKEIHPDVNKTWFVRFESEEDCVKGATWIQLEAKLRGEKVRCRIKSEHSQKSYFGTPAVGNPYAQQSPYYPQQQQASPYGMGMSPENDPEFIRWLERNPDMASQQQRSKRRSPRSRSKKQKPAPIENDEEDVDYDGIFKLINRQTFEMVVARYQSNFPEGPEKPPGHSQHRSYYTNTPASGFMTLQDIDI